MRGGWWRLTIFVAGFGVACLIAHALHADTDTSGVTIISSDAKIENGTCFSFRATARMEAPPAEVFSALAHPENSRRVRRVIESPDHRSKILEFDLVFSHMQPPPDKYVVYQAEFHFDPQKLTVSGHNVDDRPLPWNENYALAAFRNGAETVVGYNSWQCIPERPGDKPRTADSLARDLGALLKWRLENIERSIRYAAGQPASPEFRDGRRVYPTAVATPKSPQR
jgi:hypothetical protein